MSDNDIVTTTSDINNVVEKYEHRKITQKEIDEFGGIEGIMAQYFIYRKYWLDMAEREAVEEEAKNETTLLSLRNLDRGYGSGKTGRRFGEKRN